MRKEHDEALCKKYPEIFRDRNGDARTTAMVWGFECGDGWYNIINTMCEQIENYQQYLLRNGEEFSPVVATQVKEKYGILRFYYTGGDEYIEGIVDLTESLSATICETCGASGKLRDGGGWLITLCDEHAKEQGYDLEEKA